MQKKCFCSSIVKGFHVKYMAINTSQYLRFYDKTDNSLLNIHYNYLKSVKQIKKQLIYLNNIVNKPVQNLIFFYKTFKKKKDKNAY